MRQVNNLFSARETVIDRTKVFELVESAEFGGSQVDIYRNENNDVFMTIDQLAKSLDYADKSGIEKIIQRNSYLKSKEFSTTDRLSALDGKSRNVTLFTEDGIYEITMLSKKPKAREFRHFVRRLLKGLRKGQLTVQPPMTTKELLLQATTEHELRIEKVESDVHKLINETPIRNHQQAAIERTRKKKVIDLLGGKNSNAYRAMSRKVFSEIGRDFKDHFHIPRYNELPQSRFEEGIEYLKSWRPSNNTQLLIDNENNQTTLDL